MSCGDSDNDPMLMSGANPNNDLPLMSNANEILVRHFMFDFACNFEHKYFTCSAVLVLEPIEKDMESNYKKCPSKESKINSEKLRSNQIEDCFVHNGGESCKSTFCDKSQSFVVILDCHKITVNQVEEVNMTIEEMDSIKFLPSKPTLLSGVGLNYSVCDWCLKIWKDGVNCSFCFPRVIKIKYTTVPEGLSLLWVKDQDGRPSVYTYGAWINNRSLYPCQEPPNAMATWEAVVSVSEPAIVLMSGDAEAIVTNANGINHYYHYTKTALPMSTLALAVGFWKIFDISPLNRPNPKCRIAAPPSLLTKAVNELARYVVLCVKASEDMLGPYPFPRVDLLIVPRGFGSLGLASPNLIFLSQSVLAGDRSMSSRVAHEISHGWFGLLIGAKDWTEEWLSEGFATFMEDIIHLRTMNMSESEGKNFCQVSSFLRLQTLQAEMQNTSDELQILRINKGETLTSTIDGVETTVVKNGRNVEKSFLQAHYIKGYFLLEHLSELIGIDRFLQLLNDYVQLYRGQLVESKAIFQMFVLQYPDLGFSEDSFHEWLHCSGIPQQLQTKSPPQENDLFATAVAEAEKWKVMNAYFLKKKKNKRRRMNFEDFLTITSQQKILVLESLLEEERLAPQVMKFILKNYNVENTSAEVRHRWCELAVKHQYKPGFPVIENFLKNDLGMGVYLYGELIYSGIPALHSIASRCYSVLKPEMEPNFVLTIEQMFEQES